MIKEYGSYLACFCNNELSKGVSKSMKYSSPFDSKKSYRICSGYHTQNSVALIFGYAMSFVVVIINMIIRMIMISLIKWVGQDTYSAQLKSITNGVFAAQFFNTAILLVLPNANFDEIGLPFARFLEGTFYDFTTKWYTAVGYRIT